ncbi:MAG TPA: methylmalonyl-CoA mutase family protein, partial [Candidatus Micrarchaeaceae archaeon]|nr:methylmalonyl-CoA mutase family protein [Candidatus Micrarchaeaceae archaeon]
MAGKNVYRPEDTNELDYDRDLGDPGRPPFTRGSRDYTFAQRPWTRRMIVGYGLPQDSNRRLRRLLEMGQDGLIIVPDTPTQVGMDSDHPAAQPDAGRMG